MRAVNEEVESRIAEITERHPVVGFAVGVVVDGSLQSLHGFGLADIDTGVPIGENTVFRIASITKTFTAVAIMQLYEAGLVDLDAPANDYLRSYQLVPTDVSFRQPTVRHLLTHTAGLPEVAHTSGVIRPDFGESFEVGEPLPSLASFYGGTLSVAADPGSRFVYNNHGPATLGQIVEDVTGMALDRYVQDHIFVPLGMASSTLNRPDVGLATGYEIRSSGVEKVEERDMVTAGAASIYSTPNDMALYVEALLGKGSNENGRILEPETLAMMFEPHWQPDPRIPGMGLGFFRSSLGPYPVVRHQGTHPGFHSEMALAPNDGIGVVALTNGARQADFWLPAAVAGLLRELIGVADTTAGKPAPSHPELWHDLCGWYRLDAAVTDVRLRAMMGAGVEIFVRGARLMFRFLTPVPSLARGFALQPEDSNDPYVFRIDLPDDDLDPIRIVFGQDAAGETNRLFLDLMPLALHKQAPASNPRKWVARAVAGLGIVSTAVALSRKAASGASS